MSVETDPLLGTELAGYRIESVLGRGGMGAVYLAEDLRLKRRVALKLIAPELAADERFRERFLRESRLAASLDHSHVVPVHAAGETDGQLWIAMRYVQGTDLRTLLEREGPLEPGRALALVAQVASALDAAHAHGLVHRDVKPANVLVTEEDGEEHCYLSDFGLARSPEAAGDPTGAHLSGTVDYTAPEQIAREPANGRADLYSLGCVLYECLVGEPPFKRPRAVATLFAHASEPPPSLRTQQPDLPEAIDNVIAKALAKDPEDRYQTCGELAQAGREALGLGAPRFTRRRLIALSTAGAVALAAAAAVPAILLTRGKPAPRPILPLARDSLVRIDPKTGDVATAITVGSSPRGVAVGEGAVWVMNVEDRSLSEIDPETSTVIRTVSLAPAESAPNSIAVGEGAVWTAHLGAGVSLQGIWKLDLRSGSLSEVASGPRSPGAIAVGEGWVWVGLETDPSQILRIDPTTGRVVASIPFPNFDALAVGEGSIWAADLYAWLTRIDPETNELIFVGETIGAQRSMGGMAVGDGAVWVTDPDGDAVLWIDTATGGVGGTIRVGRTPRAIALGGGYVWAANQRDGTVTRIDPATLDVRTIDVGGIPTDVAAGEGAVWVTVDVR
jgi:streptogramin lyase/tRNA A-37 threonylcarbamoyl transferase component Bud32